MAGETPETVTETPVAAQEGAVEAPAVETPAEADTTEAPAQGKADEAADLLGTEARQDAQQDAGEDKPDAGEAGAGEAQPEGTKEEAVAPSYEAVELPDGIVVTDAERFNERVSAFDGKLSELEKKFNIDHEVAAAFRSEVMALAMSELAHIKTQAEQQIKAAQEQAETAYDRHIASRKQEWRDAFENSDLSGNRRQTTLDRAESAIREFAGDEAAFRAALQETGMANHPAMIRLLSNVAAAVEEGKMVPARTPASAPKSKTVKMYGT